MDTFTEADRTLLKECHAYLESVLAKLNGSAHAKPDAPSPARSAGGACFPNYGRSKGAPVVGASRGDLEYYANGCRRSLADPSKSRWHDRDRALLAAIEAELGGGGSNAPPAEGDFL